MGHPYKISVIIPVYGVEKYIERCARSLFEQTLDDIEFIFVDDCTQDNSISIVNDVLAQYPQRKDQVKIIKHEHNKGLPQARRTGVTCCTGQYITHCDSDDWVTPDIYQKMYEEAQNRNADIVCCGYYISDGINSTPVVLRRSTSLLTGPVWNKLVRSNLYKDNDIIYPTCNKAEDGALMVQISYYAKKIVELKDPLYYYYQNTESICHQNSEQAIINRLRQECANTDLRIKFLEKHDAKEKYEEDIILWKRSARINLKELLHRREYYELWKNTYPEINLQYFLCKSVSFKQKIKFLAILLRLLR